ncbi:MAG: RHS repeat-associated core domain-containing protein, partial [Edaphobacter sp.]
MATGRKLRTYQNLTLGWVYDSFGNRQSQTPSGTSGALVPAAISATYSANNQIQTTSIPGVGPQSYDAAGNLIFDGINAMAYDAENRVCASANSLTGTITQYIYDAEGRRVAKVNASSMNGGSLSCAMSPAGPVEATYILGPSGEQMTELDQAGNWKHTNIFAGGTLLATYDTAGLHFPLTDALGTKRVQVSGTGNVELSCTSLPFGDGLSCSGPGQDATEHHFTGKERDAESGLDYFGARYYASTMGRFMSPDWAAKAEPVPYSKLDNPQTLNLYAYVGNNPLSRVDPTGHADIAAECKGQSTCNKTLV